MKIEWMNDRNPLPENHAKAGQIGVIIDFEDGESEPQRVYAADERAMNDKLAKNYGSTRNTVLQLRRERTPAPPPAAPAAPPAQPTGAKAPMTDAERAQCMADLDEPKKFAAAMAKLLAEDQGFDIEEAKRQQKERRQKDEGDAYTRYMADEVAKFMRERPDFYGSPKNAKLLRSTTFARVGNKPTAADWEQSFEELLELNVLESAPATEPPPAAPPAEPSAPPPVRPSGTGVRPTQLQRAGVRLPAGQQMTRSEALDLAETDDYDHRIRHEQGFQAKIEAALSRTT